MSDLSWDYKASPLAFSRPVEGHRYTRQEVAEGPPNSRCDRGKDSGVVGVSSSRTTGLKYVGHHCRGRRGDSAGAGADVPAIAAWRSGIRVAYTRDGAE